MHALEHFCQRDSHTREGRKFSRPQFGSISEALFPAVKGNRQRRAGRCLPTRPGERGRQPRPAVAASVHGTNTLISVGVASSTFLKI